LNDNEEKTMSKTTSDQAVNPESLPTVFGHELGRLKSHWWWFLVLGVLLVIGGVVAITYPVFTSVGVVMVMGAILIISGVIMVVGAFWAGKWSAFFLQLLVGILYIMAGMVIRDAPLKSVLILTMFIAAAFIVVGVFRIVVSLTERFPQWGWSLLNGIVTMLAGLIIYDAELTIDEANPASGLWVIGLLVGLELLFNGWTWIMLSLTMRSLPDDLAEIGEA
jgi:uncharacterized membrane protein HdeD (DUF308 family)